MSKRYKCELKVAGALSATLAARFAPHHVRVEDAVTVVLANQLDQAALYGLLMLVQTLGLEFLEVRVGLVTD